ncbi:MAG: transcriptional regulator [bacterium]|nr:transcriptional regulator [bacterium]
MKHNKQPKTLGSEAGKLVTELHERGKTIFCYADVVDITGLNSKSARSLVGRMVERGVTARLKPGLFILVPFEMGREREYLGNPYVVARELTGTPVYYISHSSAMEIHRMVTQPQFVVFATAPKFLRPRHVLGTEFRFVRCKTVNLFGIISHWATKTDKVQVSDLERTVIDGLKQSEHCGGFSEVAKGFWMRREEINPHKLVDYALRLDVGAVIRRLGFLFELFEIDAPHDLDRLRERLSATYAILDPMLPNEGRLLARWRLKLNIRPEEIQSVVRT